jgi:small conductance mechanosensitive channel
MFGIEWTDGWQDSLTTAGRIVLVILLAVAVNVIVRRSISRLVSGVRAATRELDSRAPGALIRADALQRSEARANTLNSVLRSIASGTIFFFAVLIILGQLNIDLAPLLAGAGVVSIAIGFGAQSIVRDVLAGVFVLIEDQYGVGDIIDAGVAAGQVEAFTLRATHLRDAAGTVWHVPNGAIVQVGNKSQNWARAVVDVTVPSDSDVRRAREVMVAAVAQLATEERWAPKISGEPDDQGVQSMTWQGVTLRVVLDTQPAAQWAVERELRLRVKEAFDREGLALAVVGLPQAPPP